ncbi:F0F1 ATP synthase subunit epsilon [Maioricimonas rarisocia]|nr:F0F1 ATP synthase subunit epsilon [Maioricimonas rarisocia]
METTMQTGSMQLRVLAPTNIVVDEPVTKVIAEAENGSFCLEPRHVDFVAALVPGLFEFASATGEIRFMAIDEGILVKSGQEVSVSVRHAVIGPDLGDLEQTVHEEFETLDDRERVARSAIARLEADFVRRFLQLGESHRV